MTSLFNWGWFTLSSGETSRFIIECTQLNDDDYRAIASLAASKLPPYTEVYGIPQGGLRFAAALEKHVTRRVGRMVLIVGDVLTTGKSMEDARMMLGAERSIGTVLFARGKCPRWVTPIFTMIT